MLVLQVALNTVYLWGQGVTQCAVTQTTAFALTGEGVGYTWGGTSKWWTTESEFDPLAMDTNKASRILNIIICCLFLHFRLL